MKSRRNEFKLRIRPRKINHVSCQNTNSLSYHQRPCGQCHRSGQKCSKDFQLHQTQLGTPHKRKPKDLLMSDQTDPRICCQFLFKCCRRIQERYWSHQIYPASCCLCTVKRATSREQRNTTAPLKILKIKTLNSKLFKIIQDSPLAKNAVSSQRQDFRLKYKTDNTSVLSTKCVYLATTTHNMVRRTNCFIVYVLWFPGHSVAATPQMKVYPWEHGKLLVKEQKLAHPHPLWMQIWKFGFKWVQQKQNTEYKKT